MLHAGVLLATLFGLTVFGERVPLLSAGVLSREQQHGSAALLLSVTFLHMPFNVFTNRSKS